MTMKEWKAKYYPKDAREFSHATWRQAVAASLKKWRGIAAWRKTATAAEREKLREEYAFADTCAMCWLSAEGRVSEHENFLAHIPKVPDTCCSVCPLWKLGHGCDRFLSPWSEFHKTGDPQRMIDALQQTLDSLPKRVKK